MAQSPITDVSIHATTADLNSSLLRGLNTAVEGAVTVGVKMSVGVSLTFSTSARIKLSASVRSNRKGRWSIPPLSTSVNLG